MGNDTIKISCPICGAVLIVKNIPGIENKYVTCQNCKKQSHFSLFKKISDQVEKTQYDTAKSKEVTDGKIKVGHLYNPSTGAVFQLKPGKNIIGRKSPNSEADIQLDCSNYVSRNHLIIEVLGDSSNGYSYGISLFKQNVNNTFIGGNQLLFGDCLALNDGDIVKLPDLELVFKN